MSATDWELYRQMFRSRCFEELVQELWQDGLISGEMHLSAGEEGVVAGVMAHVRDGDALALDHRATAPLLMRGVDSVLLLRELLGKRDGLCSGNGGHMHLFSKRHLAASSGIVGASAPLAVGFALAHQHLNPGAMSIAFFGEGAMNQGMLLESLNLAAVWRLPVLFVCKDDGWAITTRSETVTAGGIAARARAFGLLVSEADGSDAPAVRRIAEECVAHARQGQPAFLHARCVHLEGHFLGDPMLRVVRTPLHELRSMALPLIRSLTAPGGAELSDRAIALGGTATAIGQFAAEHRKKYDPVPQLRRTLERDGTRLGELERGVSLEMRRAMQAALLEPDHSEAQVNP